MAEADKKFGYGPIESPKSGENKDGTYKGGCTSPGSKC